MLAPYAPHIAEELWEVLGGKGSAFEQRWPEYDERLASAGDVEIAIQVNGKLRSRLVVPRGMAEKDVLARALADEAVKKFVDGQPLKKIVYVQDRLVNVVSKGEFRAFWRPDRQQVTPPPLHPCRSRTCRRRCESRRGP